MKLHVGSGSVYLSGYVNIDVYGPKTFLAANRKDLVEKWKTTEDKYYAKHQDKTIDALREGPLDQEYVCDTYGDFSNLPAPYWEVDEILSRHCFEHLSIGEAHKALDQADAVLKPNGVLRLDVPDHDETLRLFQQTGDSFYIRHLLGPRRNEYGFHMMSYSRDRLKKLVEDHGFVFEAEEPNIHIYPSFCLRFRKPGPRVPYEYIGLPNIPDHWNVLDVGPGGYPLPRANAYADRTLDNLKPLQDRGATTFLGDLSEGYGQIADKEFDYVWASHVLEHVTNPVKAAATLSRIGRRGTIVMPSAMKDGMFSYEETDHKWLVLPNPAKGGPPIFVKHNPEYIDKVRDSELQKITSRLYRTGPNRHQEQRYLRSWYYQNEKHLDVVHHWADTLRVVVID